MLMSSINHLQCLTEAPIPSAFQFDKYHFRTIVYTERKDAVANAPADNHIRVIFGVKSPSYSGNKPWPGATKPPINGRRN